jgi:hypothetical protein
MADMPNLKGLRMQTAARRMANYGLEKARICQYEVPGGGECRDKACEDVHWNLLEVEPNGAPRPVTLCLFRQVIILSGGRRSTWVDVCLQMMRLRNICAGIRMWRKWFKRFKRRVLGGQRRALMSA